MSDTLVLKIKRIGGKTQVYAGVSYYEWDDAHPDLRLRYPQGDVSISRRNFTRCYVMSPSGDTIDSIPHDASPLECVEPVKPTPAQASDEASGGADAPAGKP